MTDFRQRHEGASERREWILSTLRTDGFVPISDLVRRLGVSHMTIRRDLHALESTGAVRIFHGARRSLRTRCAAPPSRTTGTPPLDTEWRRPPPPSSKRATPS